MSDQYTDWEFILGELQVISEFPDANYLEELKSLAMGWKSDPTANLDENLPRWPHGEPRDPVLRELGMLFGDYISLMTDSNCTTGNIKGLANGALVILTHIEIRSSKVMDWVGKQS